MEIADDCAELGISPQAVLVLDGESRILGISPAGLALFGADSAEALIGESMADRVVSDLQPLLTKLIASADTEREPRIIEIEMTDAENVRRRFLAHAAPLGVFGDREDDPCVLMVLFPNGVSQVSGMIGIADPAALRTRQSSETAKPSYQLTARGLDVARPHR